MKITFIDQPAIYLSEERGERIKQQVMIGAKMLDIDGNLYSTASITAITKGAEPSTWGKTKNVKRIIAPRHAAATETSDGFKKFKQARDDLAKKLANEKLGRS